ncbi:peptide ABC transporter ATP-binding protein [Spirochaetia bacterium]|nr:peptide ABC transporter ATP-binding protein [Spirochaetia bacterium]
MDADKALVRIENVYKTFKLRTNFWGSYKFVDALKNVNLSINQGESVGIVGESGSGKTTLSRIIMRLDEKTAGSINVCGVDVTALKGKALDEHYRNIQMVFQDSSWAMDPMMRVEDIVAESLDDRRYTKQGQEMMVLKILHQVGLSVEYLKKYPYELSGGQRQRVGIARAIIQNPKILILDEPTSALDMSVQAQILNLLCDIRESYGLTYLFISHDLAVVRHMCERIIVMKKGEIVEAGSSDQIFNHPQSTYTQELISAIPRMK